MLAFTPDQWLILLLAFVLGLFLGMALLASPKWKRRYREEVARREAVEAENARLRRDAAEMDSLRHAAARDEARRRDVATDDAPRRRGARRGRRRDADERTPAPPSPRRGPPPRPRPSRGRSSCLPQRRLRRRQPGDRHAIGRGADVIEAGRSRRRRCWPDRRHARRKCRA